MKAGVHIFRSVMSLLALLALERAADAQPFSLSIRPRASQVEFSWPAALTNASQPVLFPEYQLQSSTDLVSWSPIGGKVRGQDGRSGPLLSISVGKESGPIFYRLQANLNPVTQNETGTGGEEVFGYDDQFATEIQPLDQLPIEDFATNGSWISYVPQLSWDPTTAQYWTNFDSTNLINVHYGGILGGVVAYNYHLNGNELALFMTNGFVVSQRLASPTFGDAYYRLFNADLPVFITSDSVLHAWHRSYQSILEQVEELELSTLLSGVLSNMSAQLPRVQFDYWMSGSGPLLDSFLDADYYLTVARSLWAGQQVPSALGDTGVNQLVTTALTAISSETLQEIPMFGTNRVVDFSQFKIRGHYDESDRLRRYFRTMMWCGRVDLRLVAFWPNQEDSLRELGTAVVLQSLLAQAGEFHHWQAIEGITRAFVGPTDSMTFAQLGGLLTAADINSPNDIRDQSTLSNLQTRLLTGELGVQIIHSDFFWSPLGPAQVKLPRSFTVWGQKFILDGWAFSQVVFDRILWTPDDPPRILFGKVIRRKPTCLDVAFSVFGNDQTVPDLVARITSTNGVPFRDGLPYQHNLLAVRRVVDAQEPSVWSDNMYTAWLAAIRALSAPTTDPKYPEAMRTRAWAMKTLNTQLASWTELRHDTVLYAKQSYTEPLLCGYPAGFVEPRPEFWQQMQRLADVTAEAIGTLSLSGVVSVPSHDPQFPVNLTFDLSAVQATQLAFLSAFSAQMGVLGEMARKELAQQPFTTNEVNLLRNVVEQSSTYTGERQWNGWYPGLFYVTGLGGSASQKPGCDQWDPLVADVHTDLPDDVVGDPGAVIHEAVGNVHCLLIAIDNGPDRMVYAGPVLSHYEFEVPGVNRLSDADWQAELNANQQPPPPDWTSSYFVPGNFTLPPTYP
jgi:hypothetical protein